MKNANYLKTNALKKTMVQKEKKKSKILRVLPQVPKTRKSLVADMSRKARAPGLRESKKGNKYWETRQNRSDKIGTKL